MMNINKFAMPFPIQKYVFKIPPRGPPFVPPFFWAPAPFRWRRVTTFPLQVASLTVVTWMLRCLELVSEAEIAWFGLKSKLGGGFKYFLFWSLVGGEDSHFDYYFSMGLKPPTRK